MSTGRLWFAALCVVGLSACAHSKTPTPRDEGPREYLIGREDLLDVSIWRDPDLSRTVPVRPDGRISLPLVGELEVAGKSAEAVAKEISARLGPFIQDPRVVVIVREVNAPRYYVLGEVARPGGYPLRGRVTLLQALAVAGGPNEFADTDGIVVVRGEKRQRIEVDYTRLTAHDENSDFALAPGDTIYVP